MLQPRDEGALLKRRLDDFGKVFFRYIDIHDSLGKYFDGHPSIINAQVLRTNRLDATRDPGFLQLLDKHIMHVARAVGFRARRIGVLY